MYTKVLTREDIEKCVDIYIAWKSEVFLPVSREDCISNFFNLARQNKFIRVLRKDGEIVSWFYAEPSHVLHVKEPFLQIFYFCNVLTGYSAFKVIKEMHKEMIQEARRRALKTIVATNNPRDFNNTLVKLLTKLGWKQLSYMACYDVPESKQGQSSPG